MKNFIFVFLLLLLITVTGYLLPVTAVSPTPTPSNLDEIQKIRQAIQEKVKEKLKEINSPQTAPVDTKRGVLGTVIQSNLQQLTIDFQNTTSNVNLSPETIFIDQNRNKTSFGKLKIGQDILVLGYLNDNGDVDAKRIVFINLKTIENPDLVLIGKIVDISKASPIFVLIPSKNKNIQYQLKLDTKTIVVDTNNKTLDSKTLSAGLKVIVVAKPDPKLAKTFDVLKLINLNPLPTPTPKP